MKMTQSTNTMTRTIFRFVSANAGYDDRKDCVTSHNRFRRKTSNVSLLQAVAPQTVGPASQLFLFLFSAPGNNLEFKMDNK